MLPREYGRWEYVVSCMRGVVGNETGSPVGRIAAAVKRAEPVSTSLMLSASSGDEFSGVSRGGGV